MSLTSRLQAVYTHFVIDRDGQHRCFGVAGYLWTIMVEGQKLHSSHKHRVYIWHMEYLLNGSNKLHIIKDTNTLLINK